MWGLDTLDANSAIAPMNAMNISVRNGVFMPAFLGTPVVLLITALVAFLLKQRKVAVLLGFSGVIYIAGAFIPTASINVPMNIALEVYSEPFPTKRQTRSGQNIRRAGSFGTHSAQLPLGFRFCSLVLRSLHCRAAAKHP